MSASVTIRRIPLPPFPRTAVAAAVGGGLSAYIQSAAFRSWRAARAAVRLPIAPGQTRDQALAHLRSLPQLAFAAAVDCSHTDRGDVVTVHVTVVNGVSVEDPVAFAQFLVTTAWSVNAFRPRLVTIFIDYADERPFDVLAAVGAGDGVLGDETIAVISTDEWREWPGQVAYLPAGVLLPVT